MLVALSEFGNDVAPRTPVIQISIVRTLSAIVISCCSIIALDKKNQCFGVRLATNVRMEDK